MSADTSGPAFPVDELSQYDGSVCAQHFGVTVRDYFAAKALAGMLANPKSDYRADQYAYLAYALADEMLKARTQ